MIFFGSWPDLHQGIAVLGEFECVFSIAVDLHIIREMASLYPSLTCGENDVVPFGVLNQFPVQGEDRDDFLPLPYPLSQVSYVRPLPVAAGGGGLPGSQAINTTLIRENQQSVF